MALAHEKGSRLCLLLDGDLRRQQSWGYDEGIWGGKGWEGFCTEQHGTHWVFSSFLLSVQSFQNVRCPQMSVIYKLVEILPIPV